MTDKRIEEIKGRIFDNYQRKIITGQYEIHVAAYHDDVQYLLTRLEAETARADMAESGLESRLSGLATVQSKLTAANEKLAAAREQTLALISYVADEDNWLHLDEDRYKSADEILDAFNTGDGNGR